jgi:hypothetical protein
MSRRPFTLGLIIAVAIVALQALLVPLFAGPSAHLAPRDLPLAVAGPAPAAQQLAAQLQAKEPGAFDVQLVADAAAADNKIKTREVYGAIVLGSNGPAMHVASAASPTVAALLTQAGTQFGAVSTTDVLPADPDDPRGAAFGSGFLPLAITGLLAGVLIFLFVPRRAARLLALATFAVVAGFAGAAVLQLWLGVLPGDYLTDAAVLGLFALAVSGTIAGLGALLGRAGLALGALTVFLIGNALSGVASAAELLPQPWGTFGQSLPIGAGATLLRSVAYFDGNGSARAVTVLLAYAIGGLALVAVGRRGLTGRPAGAALPVAGAAPTRQTALAN